MVMAEDTEIPEQPPYDLRWMERKNGEFQSGVEDNFYWYIWNKRRRLLAKKAAEESNRVSAP
jgi:hypothetical protein